MESTAGSVATDLAVKAATSQIQSITREFSVSTTWREWFFNSMAFVALGVSGLAFLFEGGLVVSLVSGVCAFLGPCAALQQQRLTDLKTMREIQQKLRDEVNRFQVENHELKRENEKLAQSAKKLKEVEASLAQLSELQGQNVDILMKQVEEYRKIQAQIEESLEAKVIANLMEVVIRSDDDMDFIIDKCEVNGLLTKLHTIPGVDFSEENFRKAIRKAGHGMTDEEIDDMIMNQQGGFSLSCVMDIVKNLLDDKVADEDNIFTLNTEELLPRSARRQQPKNDNVKMNANNGLRGTF